MILAFDVGSADRAPPSGGVHPCTGPPKLHPGVPPQPDQEGAGPSDPATQPCTGPYVGPCTGPQMTLHRWCLTRNDVLLPKCILPCLAFQTTIDFIKKTYQNEVARPLPNSLKDTCGNQLPLEIDTPDGTAMEVSKDFHEKHNAAHVLNPNSVTSMAMGQAGIITMGLISPTHVQPSEVQDGTYSSASTVVCTAEVQNEQQPTIRI